ncbi:hypothetical protein L5515_010512 [Caenorhabditis briggsae]|uniref:Forkhead box protein pes-1 n=1 Tax=Caenorhabditis briggsae TaxID=6238 RepID=A0AAE9JF64_CAEBR|nr:hypothetical protein L5515_010512 [Caenorhabditis briggsae]
MLPISISTSPDPASQFPTVPDLPTLTPTPSPPSGTAKMNGFTISNLCAEASDRLSLEVSPSSTGLLEPKSSTVSPAPSCTGYPIFDLTGISKQSSSGVSSTRTSSLEPKSSAVSPAPSSPEASNPNKRPAYSYNALIAMAIQNSPFKALRLSEIYAYISNNFPYYKMENGGWQNSIRHNLSLREEFYKVQTTDGKGSFWAMNTQLGSEVYIGKDCGSLRRKKNGKPRKYSKRSNTVSNPNPIPQIPSFTPSPLLATPFPLFLYLSQAYAQNPNLLPMMLQNFQHFNFQNIPALSFPFPFSNSNGNPNSRN